MSREDAPNTHDSTDTTVAMTQVHPVGDHKHSDIGLEAADKVQTEKAAVRWQNVQFAVKDNQILDKCSGSLEPGELCVMMGPSGSGKTSLLDFIAGRVNPGSDRIVAGAVTINGQPRTAELMKRLASYVQQQDSLVGTLTVRETLNVAAHLSGKCDGKVCATAVEKVLKDMGLEGAAEVKIGNVFFKGVSGGQKRRVSIAEQLLSEPSLLLLDEPTSGLDSASALAVTHHLKAMAHRERKTILMTIHQPSSQMWMLFDKVCFLAHGNVLYFGKTPNVVPHFEQHTGRECLGHMNPADWVIGLINADFEDHADTAQLAVAWAESDDNKNLSANLGAAEELAGVEAVHGAGFCQRLCTLVGRDLKELLRDPGVLYVRLFMYVMLSLLIGLMFLNLGDDKDDTSIIARTGILFYVAAFMVFMAIATLPFFMMQREVFVKERCNGAYGVTEYVISKWIVSLPGIALLALSSTAIVVPMAGLNGFGIYFADLFLSLMFAEGFMYSMAALVPHYIIGMALGAGAFGFFMLCEGFLKVKSEIPPYLIWGHYMAPHTYTFRIFMYNEFNELGALQSQQFARGDDVLRFYDMDDADITADFCVLVGFAMAFQLVFFFALYFLHTGKR